MSYLGSKAASGVYQKIIAEMPPHETYIETHLGGGAIMLRKPPAIRNIGIDLDVDALKNFAFTHQLSHVNLVIEDAVDYLDSFDFTSAGRVLVYADPPYLPETRTSNNRYRFEYSVTDHERLLSCLMGLPSNVSIILSGYPSRLYDETLVGWRSKEFQAMTRGGVRTEKIWMNYQEGKAYSHAFAGKDSNDRQRIKRKVKRWKDKFSLLPPAERLAIMTALCDVE
ncbi:DNA adenine methylase [Hafnia paralvei]|uniref:DNA adenine methylase n=1 Tax=Hafnia paralvei TaxID=546367 RepID=UPI0007E3E7FE|nr:DNA adenine methylase [Hafnia paralvei]